MKALYPLLVLVTLFWGMSCKNSYYQSAKFNISQQEWEKAQIELAKLIAQNPNDGRAHFLQGDVFARQDNYEKMHDCFGRCSEITNRYETQIKYLMQRYWLDNYNAGIRYFDEGKFDEAIKRFRYATIIKPEQPIAYIHLANIYQIQYDFKNAIEIYQQAIGLNKKDIISRNHLAAIYFKENEYEKAIKICNEIVRINSKEIEAIKQLATCYELLDDMDNAIKWYDKAARILPGDKTIHTNLGIAYFSTHNLEEAIEEFKIAIEIDSLDTALFTYLGECYWKIYDYQNMVSCFQHIVDLNPNNLSAWRNLALGYNHLGQFVESDSARSQANRLKEATSKF